MVTREDLKAKRLKAMGVVGEQMQATDAMLDRVIALGDKVAEARQAAETAQTGALQGHIADLTEMVDDLEDFGNAAKVAPPLPAGAKPAGNGTAALAALQTTEPTINPKGWENGDAYESTHPDKS